MRVHIVAVERKKPHIIFLKAVVALTAHVVKFVVPLDIRVVMVAERCIEFDPGVKQRLIWLLELPIEVAGFMPALYVIPIHYYEVTLDELAEALHLTGHFELGLFAGSVVADYGKSNCPTL